MHGFWIWLASFGKVRKDEFFGFLNFVVPNKVSWFEQSLQEVIDKGYVEVGQYQKIARTAEAPDVGSGVWQLIGADIPPLMFAAFLRNQGVANVDDFIREVETMVGQHTAHAPGNGLVHNVFGGSHEIRA